MCSRIPALYHVSVHVHRGSLSPDGRPQSSRDCARGSERAARHSHADIDFLRHLTLCHTPLYVIVLTTHTCARWVVDRGLHCTSMHFRISSMHMTGGSSPLPCMQSRPNPKVVTLLDKCQGLGKCRFIVIGDGAILESVADWKK